MSKKIMIHMLSGVATIPLMTTSAAYGFTNGGSSPIISPDVTFTVPKGNPGRIVLGISTDDPADVLEYRINGGSWIDAVLNPEFTINSGQSLQFRATITNIESIVVVTIYDEIVSGNLTKTVGAWAANRIT